VPFVLIKGAFHVVNYSPDGDSIRFKPDNADLLKQLKEFKAKVNLQGHTQLRIEAIDTLETHYGSGLHQPMGLARGAAERLLDYVGIGGVVWNPATNVVTAAADGTRGYILARAVEKNGRPIAFLFAGDPAEADGSNVVLDPARLAHSYNRLALAEGLAYPTYYKGLFADLRGALTAMATAARAQGLGVWAHDGTSAGFNANNLSVLTEGVPILPKLFRRLSDYMVEAGTAVGFKAKMAQSAEPVLDLREQNFTHFDTFIDQAPNSTQIRLTRYPEELVFDEMPARPLNQFAVQLGDLPIPTEPRLAPEFA